MRLFKHCFAVLAVITPLLVTEDLSAATYYWDSNGTTAGAGVTPTGTWGTDAFWSTSSAGTAVTANTPTTTADTLNFSAGSDTVGAYTVTLNGTQSAARVIAKTGNLTLSSGTLAIPFMNTGATLDTTGTANMVIDSGIRIDNTAAGASLIFGAVAGTSIAINGTLTSTSPSPTNSIFLLQKNGTGGTVNINTNLGTDAGFLTALQGGGINGGLGTLNVNGNQTLGSTKVQWTDSGRIGTINIGSTVNTGNTVTMGQILMYHTTGNLAGANINVNSAVSLTGVTLRSGGNLNVAGSLTNSGGVVMGLVSDVTEGATMKILNGGTASLTTINVVGGSVLTNAGTLNATVLTLGEATENSSGKFVMGDATGVGTATLTTITTLGTGTANAIVGGNSAASTLTLNLSGSTNFTGKLGGAGANENNLAFVKQGSTTLTLSGLNTYTGATTINAGALKAGVATSGASGAFGNNSAVTLANVAGANLDTTGFNNSIGSLAGGGVTGGNVILGAATLTVGGDNSSTFYQGVISGTGGSLVKTGSGQLNLNRTETFTGTTTVSAGTLLISGGNLNANSGVSVASAATFTYNSGTAFSTALTLAEGAALGGTGSFTPTAMTLTADLSDGFTTFALASTAFTRAGNLELTLSGIANNTYTLFTGSAISGAFTSMSINGTSLASQGGGDFSGVVGANNYTFTSLNNQLIVAVPEPATWGLLAFSLTTVMVMRRRRRS